MLASDYLAERTESQLKRLGWLSKNAYDLEGINVENGKLHIERMEKDTPVEVRDFSISLYELLFAH